MSEKAKQLVGRLCRRNPTERIGYSRMDELRRDPWFAGFDFAKFRAHTMRPPIRPKVNKIQIWKKDEYLFQTFNSVYMH